MSYEPLLATDVLVELAGPWKYHLTDDPQRIRKLGKIPVYLTRLNKLIEASATNKIAYHVVVYLVDSLGDWLLTVLSKSSHHSEMTEQYPNLPTATVQSLLTAWQSFEAVFRVSRVEKVSVETEPYRKLLMECAVEVSSHVHNVVPKRTRKTRQVVSWMTSLVTIHTLVLVATFVVMAWALSVTDDKQSPSFYALCVGVALCFISNVTFPFYVARVRKRRGKAMSKIYCLLDATWQCLCRCGYDTLLQHERLGTSTYTDSPLVSAGNPNSGGLVPKASTVSSSATGGSDHVRRKSVMMIGSQNGSGGSGGSGAGEEALSTLIAPSVWGILNIRVNDDFATANALLFYEQFFVVQISCDYIVMRWGKGAEILTGFTKTDVLNQSFTALLPTADSQGAFDRLVATCLKGGNATEKLRIVCANQTTIPVEACATFLKSAEGKLCGIMLACRPLNTTPHVQSILDCYRAALFEKHLADFRLKLQSGAPVKILMQELVSLEQYFLNLPSPATAALNFQDATPTSIRAMIGGVSDKLRTSLIGTRTKFREVVDDNVYPDTTLLNEERISDVLSYLLYNAVRFTAEGEVVLHVKKTMLPRSQSRSQYQQIDFSAEAIEFYVTDTGSGFPEDKLQDLTTWPYRQTSDHKLLTIKSALIYQYSELRCLETKKDGGSTMMLRLPMLSQDVFTGADGAQSKFENSLSMSLAEIALGIIVYEPMQLYRSVLTRYLMEYGHSVKVAKTYTELVERLREAKHHAAFVDVQATRVEQLINDFAPEDVGSVMVIFTSLRFTPSEMSFEGFHFLTKPYRNSTVALALRAAEDRASQQRKNDQEITRIRAIFATHKTCRWTRGETLGSGGFGIVCKATNLLTGGTMAVKTVTLDSEQKTLELLNELEMLTNLEHRNIIHYLYCERDESAVNIFMEYAEGGSVAQKISTMPGGPQGLPQSMIIACMRDVLSGLAHIHSHGIVHRDIKAANILITGHTYKIADFQTAVKMTDGKLLIGVAGTPRFMAPEVMRSEEYGWQCDIWSVGCLVMELVTGMRPFHEIDDVRQFMEFLRKLTNTSEVPLPQLGKNVSDLSIKFMRSCLQVNWKVRPSARELLNHPFITRSTKGMDRAGGAQSPSSTEANNVSGWEAMPGSGANGLIDDYDRKFSTWSVSNYEKDY